jgi:S-adenosylmethionine:tRNA ribosyltransferase-isomerase
VKDVHDIAQYDYRLPEELIAQYPVRKRDASRLLIYDRQSGEIQHRRFGDIVSQFRRGDLLVVNNTKVFKARLLGRRPTGAKVEVLLVRQLPEHGGEAWLGLLRPARRVKKGENILFDNRESLILEDDVGGGCWLVRFSSRSARERIVQRFGHVPLPPYIARGDEPSDVRRYQTVFADSDKQGAIAAPTAGFHFTRSILDALKKKGVRMAQVTLHVGPGTFKPIMTDDIRDHTVDAEYAELSETTAKSINKVRAKGGKVIAVGTTSVRTLESAKIVDGEIQPFAGMVNLYIRPGRRFRVVDHLVTNFHLPKSSLLVLVSAFAGREEILRVYEEAIQERYRFYSYGDAMLIR